MSQNLTNDWKRIALGDVAKTATGGTPSREVDEYFGGDIPWVKSGDLNDGIVSLTTEKITQAGMENSNAKFFPSGTLLIALYGATVGKLAILGVDATTNQAVCAIFPDESVERRFLFYYLLKERQNLIAKSFGGAQPNISQEIIRNMQIPIPPLPEQRRIAALLDKADRLRRTHCYAAQLSDTFLQAVFVRMFGDPVRNPMGWQLERLAEVLELPPQYGLYVPQESYSSDPKEGIEMVHMSDLFYGIVDRGLLRRVKSDVAGLEAYHVDPSDLLIARRSLNYEGAAKPCRIPKSDEPLLFESSMLRIRPNRKKMHPIYLYHYLADERARIAHVQKFVTRSTISGINQSNLCDVEVLCPPLVLQQKFARIVQQFERLRAQQREAERQAEHLFQTLLHRAFQGEV